MMKAFSKILNIILLVTLSLSLLTVPCFAAGDDVEFIFSGDEIVIDSSEWTKDQIVIKKSGVLETWKINSCDIYLVDGDGDELFELENKGETVIGEKLNLFNRKVTIDLADYGFESEAQRIAALVAAGIGKVKGIRVEVKFSCNDRTELRSVTHPGKYKIPIVP